MIEADAPAIVVGFLRAVCAIANEATSKGGMSVTYYRVVQPPDFPAESLGEDRLTISFSAESLGEDRLMTRFFAEALGSFNAAAPERLGYLVYELRRVVREATGAELVAACVVGSESDPHHALGLWWRSGAGYDLALLRRSRD